MDPTNSGNGSSETDWAEQLFGHKPGSEPGECPYTCPVCMGLALVKQMRPEVAAHLMAAGREFFLAAKALMDSVAEPPGPGGSGTVQKIPVD
ncbi:MAG TPA: hypothetical protein VNA87_00655 [Actinomycetota bacterium]|nr:hypothetical protein [Actinomycetota bacterium]